MKKEIIKDWNEFVVKELCPARCGHLRFKIRDFWLQKIEAEKQKWVEAEIKRLEEMKKILDGKQVDAEFHANYGFNEAIDDQIPHLKELLETLTDK